ncbi:MAG: signal peptidase II [Oscillospiraceae bacterium]|nr:signal peptidase II [Oscillospiraceae bacterium]
MLYSIVALLVVILDQAVKYWVTNTLMGYDIVKFIPGVISLVNVPNDGAAFSMLSGGGARIYFIIVTVVFCIAVILALATNFVSGRVARWSLVMVAAGGFANCIDRVIYGYVVDMFKVELFNFAIFNVADIFITVFAVVFALAIIFEKPHKDEDDEDDYDQDEEEEEDDGDTKRRPLFARFRRDDKENEEEAEHPRRGKKAKYEEEYQEYKASQRPSRPAAQSSTKEPAAPVRPAPQAQAPKARPAAPASSDPFAAWERANARVDAQRAGSYAARAMDVPAQPQAARPAAPQQPAYRPPVQRPAQQAAPQSPAPVEPAARPSAPQPKPAAPASTEFDLDDILNEFK